MSLAPECRPFPSSAWSATLVLLLCALTFGPPPRAAHANPADGTWLAISPPPRDIAWRAILDSRRNRMLVISSFREIWALDLAYPGHWSKLQTVGEGSCYVLSMAVYDSTRDRVVVWGCPGPPARLWQLSFAVDPPAWSQISYGGTFVAYENCSQAYDSARNRVLVFGGNSGYCGPGCDGNTNDVYALTLDAPAGEKLTTTGNPPSKRSNASMIYDSARDRLIVFGGGNGMNDVHALTLSGTPTWSTIVPEGTLPSASTSAAWYDRAGDRMLILVGRLVALGSEPTELWELRLPGTHPATLLASPSFAYGSPTGVLVPSENRIVTIGDVDRDGQVLQFPLDAPAAWSEIVATPWGPPPPGRMFYSVVSDLAHDRLIVFGSDLPNTPTTWVMPFDAVSGWQNIPGPPPTSRHSAVIDAERNQMITFGGMEGSTYVNTVRRLDLETLQWSVITPAGTPPSPRANHVAVFDPAGDRMIVFGGSSNVYFPDSLWELSVAGAPEWHQLPMTAQPQLPGHAVFDPIRRRMIYYTINGVMHSLDLGGSLQWSTTFTPTAPASGPMIYDSNRDRILMWSGTAAGTGLVEMSLTAPSPAWRVLDPNGARPGARDGAGITYDPVRDRMVLLGGSGSPGYRSDVWWLLTSNVSAAPRPAASHLAVDAYPNPTLGPCTIRFEMTRPGAADVTVFDLGGRVVRRLHPGDGPAGPRRLVWDGTDDSGARVSPGIYVFSIVADGRRQGGRLAVVQ